MRPKKKNLPLLEKVLISGVAAEGVAIARVNEKVLFVPWLAPGDIADIQVTRSKNSYMKGRALAVHTFSDQRVTPFCEHFGVCGGCKWQHLGYNFQLTFKQQQVVDSLTRIAHIQDPPVLNIIASDPIREYRNKLEFTFASRRWLAKEEIIAGEEIPKQNGLGFHLSGVFDKVLDIHECHLMPGFVNELRNAVRIYSMEKELAFYDYRQHIGFLRNLIVRTTTTGDIMVILVVAQEIELDLFPMLSFIQERFPQISSLMYVINSKHNDSISDLEVKLFAGKAYMMEKMEDLQFKIGPLSFFQTNSKQALTLYGVVRSFAALSGEEVVYDLYTGTGTIANFLASKASKVVGIEYIPQAIEDAHINSQLNGIENTVFYAGDMAKVFTEEFVAANGKADVLITDPPRAGMHPDVVEQILKMAPSKVVYVSCNPATQARDIALMKESYDLVAVQPVDMFPHTHHVESVALLHLKP